MLPWLVIPLIGLWALSQLLPPAFRFEITSPRLACISNTGIVKDLVGKSGKILNGKVWSENGWMCSQDWLENGNWAGGSVLGNPINWKMNGNGSVFGDEHCLTSRSYSGVLVFVCRLLASFFLTIRWIWRKIFSIRSREECLSDAERRALLAKRDENGENLNESRGERARRKAEEKRQARLERELLEEEERKQREEVAKLVEERRRLRDETMEAEKDKSKLSHTSKEKDRRKEAEKKRQERRKEKDKGSSKSNSDVEEIEKRATKESERKRDFDKKSETDRREHQKSGLESGKGQSTDTAHSKKFNSYNRGSTGTRYLDRMRGTILSSSKALGFGKGANIPATVVKESKSNNSVDHAHTAASRRDIFPPERPTTKSNLNGDDKNINRSVLPEPQAWTVPKMSWHQLFTRSSSVPKSSNSNVICRPNSKSVGEAKSPQLSGQAPITQSFNNPIQFGLPSPFNISTHLNGSTSSSLGFSPPIEPVLSPIVNTSHDFRHEEQELFEDPCYDPNPLSLLGPVSESLDNFQLDFGSGFLKDTEVVKPRSLRNTSGTDVNKPSPIESPLTREKNNGSNRFTSIPQAQDIHPFPLDDAAANEKGTWQMWSSSPLGPEALGFVGGPESWLLSSQRNVPTNGNFMLPACQKTMATVFNKDDNIISSSYSAQNAFLPNGNSGGTFSPVAVSTGYDPWLQKGLFPPLSSGLKTHQTAQNERIYGSPSGSSSSNVLECSTANGWSK
ncbi:hypothetical protein TSUD_178460 [Trifolium subterraneum]|uniref:Uncharacterized protein n=1 Tax=Trifolium subterraneum TaxID=3900 RepID=A0A2Z6LJ00_TRISU|nr:hypothetical protein TSUD_178460 [Trifolium subterraneum]